MNHYKRLSVRLLVLGALLTVGVLSKPQPASALTCDLACIECKDQCNADYWSCVQSGAFGCQEIHIDCLNSCET